MSKKKEPKWDPIPDLRFHTTEYVVDATHDEAFMFWQRWSEQYGVKMEQDNLGYWTQIGKRDGDPICVSVYWWIIEDLFRVAFIEGTSLLVDHDMIRRWEESVFRCMSEPGTGGRHSNAANFTHVLGDIGRRTKRSPFRRDFREVEKAIRKLPLKERKYGEG